MRKIGPVCPSGRLAGITSGSGADAWITHSHGVLKVMAVCGAQVFEYKQHIESLRRYSEDILVVMCWELRKDLKIELHSFRDQVVLREIALVDRMQNEGIPCHSELLHNLLSEKLLLNRIF